MADCARRGEEDLTWKRMVREIEDEKSKWGSLSHPKQLKLCGRHVRARTTKEKERGENA